MNTHPILYCDGLAKGNPGPAATSFVYCDSTGKELTAIGQPIGITTNNVAEYRALIAGLEHSLTHSKQILIRLDSKLIVEQIKGVYVCKAPGLKPLLQRAHDLLDLFHAWNIIWIPRDENKRADKIANLALERARVMIWKNGDLQKTL